MLGNFILLGMFRYSKLALWDSLQRLLTALPFILFWSKSRSTTLTYYLVTSWIRECNKETSKGRKELEGFLGDRMGLGGIKGGVNLKLV